jgi:hypothetical protein
MLYSDKMVYANPYLPTIVLDANSINISPHVNPHIILELNRFKKLPNKNILEI